MEDNYLINTSIYKIKNAIKTIQEFNIDDEPLQFYAETILSEVDQLQQLIRLDQPHVNVLDAIMGIDEASEKWGLECTTIRKICQRNEIPCRKIGDTWLIPINVERPRVQRDLFVWKDFILPSRFYSNEEVERFKVLDLEHELDTAVVKIKRLKDNRVRGDNRRSIKGNLIDQFRKMNIKVFATISGSAQERKEFLIGIIEKRLKNDG